MSLFDFLVFCLTSFSVATELPGSILSSILWSPAQPFCFIGSWVILTRGQEGRGRKEHRCLSPVQAVCPLVCWYSDKLIMAACQISQGIDYHACSSGLSLLLLESMVCTLVSRWGECFINVLVAGKTKKGKWIGDSLSLLQVSTKWDVMTQGPGFKTWTK